eukprot:jgi/Picsp_1/3883/NSC_01395-R1_protein
MRRESSEKEVFVLAVNLQFAHETDRDLFIQKWHRLADYVAEFEPDTLSFECCIADTNPVLCLVYERYRNKSAYLQHRESAEFKTFKQWFDSGMLSKKPEIDGQSYIETNQGFM